MDPSAAGDDIRDVTNIIIDLRIYDNATELREYMEITTIDWDAFLQHTLEFPHLRQIMIQFTAADTSDSRSRETIVELIAHMGEAWTDLGGLLGLYCGIQYFDCGVFPVDWTPLQLDDMLDGINRRVCLPLFRIRACTVFFLTW